MAVSLTHATVAVGTDAENGEIRKAQWNEGHTLTAGANSVLARAGDTGGAVGEVALSVEQLLGRGASGDIAAITLGANLTMTGTELAAAGGSPGGSSGQLQYNDGSAFAGMAGTSWDNTTRSLTITGATVTASSPILNLSQTWNDAAVTFAGLRLNVTDTASAAASLLLDLQVGGTSFVSASKAGDLISRRMFAFTTPQTIFSGDAFGFGSSKSNGLVGGYSSSQLIIAVGPKFALGNKNDALEVALGVSIGWASTPGSGHGGGSLSGDLYLARDAADTLAQRRSTNAQTSRLYFSFTDASNYTRLALKTATGIHTLETESAGTGEANIDLALTPKGTGRVRFGTHAAIDAETVTGYIEIKDEGGTVRKVAIVS
jgi:hypothetical protein